MAVTVRTASESDLGGIVAFIAAQQQNPTTHVPYLATDADSIRTDIDEIEDWAAVTAVAESNGQLVGVLIPEIDPDMGRLWWWGPWVGSEDADTVATQLHAAATALLPDGIDEQEACGDDRNELVRRWCSAHGLVANDASVLLRRNHEQDHTPDPRVRPVAEADLPALIELHEAAFAKTHSTGQALFASDNPRLAAIVDDTPVGYVAHEMQSDGSGYLDYLAVRDDVQNQGLGRVLVEAACADLFRRGATHVHLTVRETNSPARALYARAGFVEDRLARPYRLGFSLQ
jgi:ribosomal-protein-alanine N-acetyltransferase